MSQEQLAAILARNERVEADKAWETSYTRRGCIMLITYLSACTILWVIGVPNWYAGAVVPVAGFWLSTLGLPWLQQRWMRRYIDKRNKK
ncbi:MAG: hypothetical protein GC134_00890 [Proteobacteria bacterium]|nr:hypothetical protein [Pseudomonadota bacterium]